MVKSGQSQVNGKPEVDGRIHNVLDAFRNEERNHVKNKPSWKQLPTTFCCRDMESIWYLAFDIVR